MNADQPSETTAPQAPQAFVSCEGAGFSVVPGSGVDDAALKIASRIVHAAVWPRRAEDKIRVIRAIVTAEVGSIGIKRDHVVQELASQVAALETEIERLRMFIRSIKNASTDALYAEPKHWCAMCGKWGDHSSGSCPELHPQNDKDEPRGGP